MPSKRSSNAPRLSRQTQNDLIGLGMAVLAIAMCLALVMPSEALVAQAARTALTMCFGAGALLVPAALFVFAMTYFIERAQVFSWRIATGLALVVVAILAVLSLNIPGAEANQQLLFYPLQLKGAGGYVGSGIAFALLTLVGKPIGLVLLAGIILAGVIVCGFSISDLVTRVRAKMGDAKRVLEERSELRRQRKEEEQLYRSSQQSARNEQAYAPAPEEMASDKPRGRKRKKADMVDTPGQIPLFDETGEGQTSYLGSRKTTVLKREQPKPTDEGDGAEDTSSPTALTHTLLFGKKHKDSAVKTQESTSDKDAADSEEVEPPTTVLKPEPVSAVSARKEGRKAQVMPELEGSQSLKQVSSALPFENAEIVSDSGDATKSLDASSHEQHPSFEHAQTATTRFEPPAELERPGDADEHYELPPLSMLTRNPSNAVSAMSKDDLREMAYKLQATLEEFRSTSKVEGWTSGPSVTTFQVSTGEGERVTKVTNLEDDIALSLAAPSVRIFAPIPGTSYVGVEIPNSKVMPVRLGDVLPFVTDGPLNVAFGLDSEGKPITRDLHTLPHLLVAGTTGSGKSVLINSLVMSMLMRATPDQVRFIMVDPKRVEFSAYEGLPHLYVPVVTEPRLAASALQWAVTEMDRRFKVFNHYDVKEIDSYNNVVSSGKYDEMDNPPKRIPYFVIVIDELADLMMVAGKEVEASIIRIAQLGRAAGVHLIVATQRPSADVVTGLIRANIDNRVALSVDNKLNSRIILDETGAEQLLGRGDMLAKFRGNRGGKPIRAQGCFVPDEEIHAVVEHIRSQRPAEYHEDILTAVQPQPLSAADASNNNDRDTDPLMWEAAQRVVESQLGSTSSLQRALSVGYARAGRIMDILESRGIVGPQNGTKPRDVLISLEELEDLKLAEEQYREV